VFDVVYLETYALYCVFSTTDAAIMLCMFPGTFGVVVSFGLVRCVVDIRLDAFDVFFPFTGAENVGIVLANDVADICSLVFLSVGDSTIVKALGLVVSPVDIFGLIIVDASIDCASVDAAIEFVVFEVAG